MFVLEDSFAEETLNVLLEAMSQSANASLASTLMEKVAEKSNVSLTMNAATIRCAKTTCARSFAF